MVVKKAGYLTDAQKVKFLGLVPAMTPVQLADFSKIIEWAELQKKNLDRERNIALTGVAKIFTCLNKIALKRARKDAFEGVEKKQRKQEEVDVENLLNQIDHEV